MDTVYGKLMSSRSSITGSVRDFQATSFSSKNKESLKQRPVFSFVFFSNLFDLFEV